MLGVSLMRLDCMVTSCVVIICAQNCEKSKLDGIRKTGKFHPNLVT